MKSNFAVLACAALLGRCHGRQGAARGQDRRALSAVGSDRADRRRRGRGGEDGAGDRQRGRRSAAAARQEQGLAGPRRRQGQHRRGRPPGQARGRPERDRAPDHAGEGARRVRRLLLLGDGGSKPGCRARRRSLPQCRVLAAGADAAWPQVLLPHLADGRDLLAADVRLPEGFRRQDGREVRVRVHLPRGHSLRHRQRQGAGEARQGRRHQGAREDHLQGADHIADLGGAAPEGRQCGRADAFLLHVGHLPAAAHGQGARLQSQADRRPERRLHRPDLHQHDGQGCGGRRSRARRINSDLEGRIPLLSKVNAIFKKHSNGRDLSDVSGARLHGLHDAAGRPQPGRARRIPRSCARRWPRPTSHPTN